MEAVVVVDNNNSDFVRYQFGDTEFHVPSRYRSMRPLGIGAQGTVW